MGNEKNLVDLRTRTPEERKEIQAKGGRNSNTPKKSASMKVAWLKRNGYSTDLSEKMVELISDPGLSSLDILGYLDKIKKDVDAGLAPNYQTKIQLTKAFIDWHKATHGTKEFQKIEHSGMMPINIQVNVSQAAKDLHLQNAALPDKGNVDEKRA